MAAMTAARLNVAVEILILYVVVYYLHICLVEKIGKVWFVLLQLLPHFHGYPHKLFIWIGTVRVEELYYVTIPTETAPMAPIGVVLIQQYDVIYILR